MENFCLITGASGEIGKEFAQIFAKNGHGLILAVRSTNKLEALCTELKNAYGAEVIPCCTGLTYSAEIQRIYDCTKENGWQADCLVNNAGFGDMSAFLNADWPRQQALIDLNISAVVRLTYLLACLGTVQLSLFISLAIPMGCLR